MITAERYLKEKLAEHKKGASPEFIIKVMQDFADEHVREALEKASRKALIVREDGSKCLAFGGSHGISASIDKHSITNAYPKSRYIL